MNAKILRNTTSKHCEKETQPTFSTQIDSICFLLIRAPHLFKSDCQDCVFFIPGGGKLKLVSI